MATDPATALPTLTIRPALPAELPAALKLITDSIAQQRQTLNRALLCHPAIAAPYLALLAFLARNHVGSPGDFLQILLLLAGVSVAALSLLGRVSEGYVERAEALGSPAGMAQLEGAGSDVVVAVWGGGEERGERGEVIGTAVVRDAVMGDGDGGRAEVWAWAVRLRYRRKGLGRDLLRLAVGRARGRLGSEAEVAFAGDHANSYRLGHVPKMFNSVFNEREDQARAVLARIVAEDK